MKDPVASNGVDNELHLKMCKKVAQLTKVIYQLNTRNEDAELEIEHVKRVYSENLQEVVEDSTRELRSLQKELAMQKEAASSAQKKEIKYKEKHETDMAKLQHEARTRQEMMEEAFRLKADEMSNQLGALETSYRNQLEQCIGKLASEHDASLEKAIDNLKSQHAEEMNSLRQQHATQNEEITSESSIRIDALKKQLADAKEGYEAAMLRDKESQAHELQAVKQEARDALNSTKQNLLTQVQELQEFVEQLKKEERKLLEERELSREEQSSLKKTIQQLEKQISASQQEKENVLKDGHNQVEKLKNALDEEASKAETAQQEIESKAKVINDLEESVKQLETQLESIKQKGIEHEQESSNRLVEYSQRLKDKEAELQNVLESMEVQEKESKLVASSHEERIQSLTSDLKRLDEKHQDTLKSLQKSQLELKQLKEASDLANAALQNSNAELEKEMVTLTNAHNVKLQEIENKYANEILSLNRKLEQELQSVNEKARRDANGLLENQKVTLVKAHEQELQNARSIFDVEAKKLKEDICQSEKKANEMEAQCQSLTTKASSLEYQVKILEKEKTTLLSSVKDLERQADGIKEKSKKAKDEGIKKIDELQGIISFKESEMKHMKAEQDKLKAEHAKTCKDIHEKHASALSRVRGEYSAAEVQKVEEVTAQLTDQFKKELANVQSRHDHKVTELEIQHRLENDQWGMVQEELIALAIEINTRSAKCALSKESQYKEALQSIRDQFEKQLKVQSDQYKEELSKLREQLVQESQESMDKMKTEATTQMAELSKRHSEEIDRLQKKYNEESASAISALQSQLELEHLNELSRKQTEHEFLLQTTRERYDREYACQSAKLMETEEELQDTRRKLENSSSEVAKIASILETTRQELTQRLHDLESERQQDIAILEQQYLQNMDNLKSQAKTEMDKLIEEHLVETANLNEQFEEARCLSDERIQALQDTIAQWEVKYAERESRPEDVKRILELQQFAAEKDAAMRRINGEMAYLKREVMNREEMYNKTFARSPNVGLLQVLQPKGPNGMVGNFERRGTPDDVVFRSRQQPILYANKKKSKPPSSARNLKTSNAELRRRSSEGAGGAIEQNDGLPPLSRRTNNQQYM